MAQLSKMLPACGFVIAVALVGITSSFKDAPKTKGGADLLAFEYTPPTTGDYSQTSVQDETHWHFTSNVTRCSDDDQEACKIYVPNDPMYIGPGNTLKSDIDIVAGGPSSQAYVDHTDAGSGPDYVSNKEAVE